jgi:hypothetical protein
MKLKKTLIGLSTVIAAGIATTSVITSCSGVSKDIINNLVNRGDGTILASGVAGTASAN